MNLLACLAYYADAITAAATCLGVLVAGCALAGLFIQLRNQQAEAKRQAVTRLLEEVATPDFRRKLRFVYFSEPNDLLLGKMTAIEREAVEEVTARFDAIAYRARTGQIPFDDTYKLFYDLVLRTARQLRPHVKDQRKTRREGTDKPDYKSDFDWLATKCKIRQLENGFPNEDTDYNALDLNALLDLHPLEIFKIRDKGEPQEGPPSLLSPSTKRSSLRKPSSPKPKRHVAGGARH